jgi:hypothetical protein
MKKCYIYWFKISIVVSCISCQLSLQAQAPRHLETRRADTARAQVLGSQSLQPDPLSGNASLEAPKMTGDDEYGEQLILARRADAEPWSLALDAQYFFTDNVALVPEGQLEDQFLRTGFTAQYANRIYDDWFMDLGLSSYLYLYDEFEFFDFNLLRAEVGITKRLPKLADAFLSAHYSWFRISDSELKDSAFQDQIINLYLQKIWKISRGQQFMIGTGADISLAPEPVEPRRNEYSAFTSYRLRLTESLSILGGYRGAYYDYTEIDRQDWNHSLTVGCVYELTDWARASITATGSVNRSSNPFFDYNNIVSGVGVSLHIEF